MTSNTTLVNLDLVPAAPAPAGIVSNLVNPDTYWTYTVTVAACTIGVTVPAVAIRMFTKLHTQKRIDLEDYILILAQIGLIVWETLYLVQPTRGAHIWDTSVADASRLLYWSNLIIVLFCPFVLLAKWTIVLQIQRVFFVTKGSFSWWLSQATVWGSTLFYSIVFFCDLFQCIPREKIWNPTVPGRCLSINAILITTCFFNIATSTAIVAVPILVVKDLNMNKKRKMTASVVFGLTVLALISAVLRLVFTFEFVHSADPTRAIFPVGYWAGAEMAFIIFATAVPTFPRFPEALGCTGSRRKSRATNLSVGNTLTAKPSQTPSSPASPMDVETAWDNIQGLGGSQWTSVEMNTWDSRRAPGGPAAYSQQHRRQSLGGILKTVEFGVEQV